jgi:hypothetical protein
MATDAGSRWSCGPDDYRRRCRAVDVGWGPPPLTSARLARRQAAAAWVADPMAIRSRSSNESASDCPAAATLLPATCLRQSRLAATVNHDYRMRAAQPEGLQRAASLNSTDETAPNGQPSSPVNGRATGSSLSRRHRRLARHHRHHRWSWGDAALSAGPRFRVFFVLVATGQMLVIAVCPGTSISLSGHVTLGGGGGRGER